MTQFSDFEPEDAWAPDDPIDEQIRNLGLRIALLYSEGAAINTPRVRMLEVFAAALSNVRRLELNDRAVLHADEAEADIEYVWDRLG